MWHRAASIRWLGKRLQRVVVDCRPGQCYKAANCTTIVAAEPSWARYATLFCCSVGRYTFSRYRSAFLASLCTAPTQGPPGQRPTRLYHLVAALRLRRCCREAPRTRPLSHLPCLQRRRPRASTRNRSVSSCSADRGGVPTVSFLHAEMQPLLGGSVAELLERENPGT